MCAAGILLIEKVDWNNVLVARHYLTKSKVVIQSTCRNIGSNYVASFPGLPSHAQCNMQTIVCYIVHAGERGRPGNEARVKPHH